MGKARPTLQKKNVARTMRGAPLLRVVLKANNLCILMTQEH